MHTVSTLSHFHFFHIGIIEEWDEIGISMLRKNRSWRRIPSIIISQEIEPLQKQMTSLNTKRIHQSKTSLPCSRLFLLLWFDEVRMSVGWFRSSNLSEDSVSLAKGNESLLCITTIHSMSHLFSYRWFGLSSIETDSGRCLPLDFSLCNGTSRILIHADEHFFGFAGKIRDLAQPWHPSID